MKPSARRVLAALRTGPQTTGQLAEAGGVRFGARLEELRNLGYGITEKRVRQGRSLYMLTTDRPALAVVRPPLDGRWAACGSCSFRWEQEGMKDGCPRCGEGIHWVLEFHTAAERDAAAERIDPEQVHAEREWWKRFFADRDRARAEAA